MDFKKSSSILIVSTLLGTSCFLPLNQTQAKTNSTEDTKQLVNTANESLILEDLTTGLSEQVPGGGSSYSFSGSFSGSVPAKGTAAGMSAALGVALPKNLYTVSIAGALAAFASYTNDFYYTVDMYTKYSKDYIHVKRIITFYSDSSRTNIVAGPHTAYQKKSKK